MGDAARSGGAPLGMQWAAAALLALALAAGCGRDPMARDPRNARVSPTVTIVEWLPGDAMRADGAPIADLGALAAHARAARAQHPGLQALLVTPSEAPQDRVTAIRDTLLAADFLAVAHVPVRDVGAPPTATGELAVAPAAPAGVRSAEWTCWYPLEALRRDVARETTVLRVLVGTDGTPRGVQMLRDPGVGFGRVSAACAMIRTYRPAKDAQGRAVEAMTPPIRIHFGR